MNYYTVNTNIDCVACLDGTLIDMFYNKELFQLIYYSWNEWNNPIIVCASILDQNKLSDFIYDTFVVWFKIQIQSLDKTEFDIFCGSMNHYTKSILEREEIMPTKIQNIFDCWFPNSKSQKQWIVVCLFLNIWTVKCLYLIPWLHQWRTVRINSSYNQNSYKTILMKI